jgi:hypothetical protein
MIHRGGRTLRAALLLGSVVVLATAVTTRASASDDLAGCRAITTAAARLACYDALADAAASPGPASPSAAVPTATPTATDLFGRDSSEAVAALGAAAGLTQLEELVATVSGVARANDGRLSLDLDNGQSWLQVDTRRATIDPGVEVRIRRAAFGSYLLSTTDDRRSALRVRRIR